MKAVYVAGAYNATSAKGVFDNMRRGFRLAIAVRKAGMCPLGVPWGDYQHVLMDEEADEEGLKAVSMEALRRADAVIVVEEGWEKSRGTLAEIEEARRLGKPAFWSLAELRAWAKS